MQSRMFYIDYIKAIAMLYIVAFWHLDDYIDNLFYSKYTESLTYAFLSIFIYMSSYLFTKKQIILNDIIEVKRLLIKRILRLYPLYFMALVLFYLTDIIPLESFLSGVFLINTILNIHVKTLWFISILITYYAIFVFILYKFSYFKMFITLIFIVVLGLFLKINYNLIDIRFFYYLVPFILGFLSSRSKFICNFMHSKVLFVITLLILFAISTIINNFDFTYNSFLYKLVFIIFSIPIILVSFEFISKRMTNSFMHLVLMNLSYASFCIYIFHRIIYYLLLDFYNPENILLKAAYLFLIGFPLIYIVSFYIQSKYDLIIKKLIGMKHNA